MAKETKKTDPFDLDSELDFGFDDSFSSDINREAIKKNSRHPVLDVTKGMAKGAAKRLTEPGFIRKVAGHALPKEYATIFSQTDKVLGSTAALYDETVRELKPSAAKLASKVNKLVPDNQKTLKKITSWADEKLGGSRQQYSSPSKEDIENESITNTLNEVFGSQAKQDAEIEAERRAREDVRDGIELKKYKSTISVLQDLRKNMAMVSGYTTNVTQAYQKKSLELQFRSYFIQAEMLRTQKEFSEKAVAQYEAIAKNTALPEFLKIKQSERWQEYMRDRLIEKGTNMFGGSRYVEGVKKRIGNAVKDKARSMREAFEAGISGIDTYNTMADMNKTMAEAGMGGQSNSEMVGEMVGSGVLDEFAGKFGKLLKENIVDKNYKIVNAGKQGAAIANNLAGELYDQRNNQKLSEKEMEGGWKGKIAGGIRNLLGMLGDNPNTNISRDVGEGGINSPTQLTNKFTMTVQEVIPGFLARIAQGITVLATGNKQAEMLRYDFKSGKFMNSSEKSSKLMASLAKSVNDSSLGYRANKFTDALFEKDNLTPEQRKKVQDFGYQASRYQMKYSPERIRKLKEYEALDDETKAIFEKKFGEMSDDSEEAEDLKMKLSDALADIRKSIPSLYGEIKEMIQDGDGDLLIKEGVVKQLPDGSYDFDEEMLKEFVKKHGIAVSDVHAKKGFQKFNPKAALRGIKKTPVSLWNYKKNSPYSIWGGQKDTDDKNLGPMAQDVKKNLGDDAAPGGTSIDLVSMNGMTMAAIQALDDKFEKNNLSPVVKYLKLIARNTKQLTTMGGVGGGAGGGFVGSGKARGERGYGDLAKDAIGTVTETGFKFATDALSGIGKVLSGVKSGGSWLKDKLGAIYDKNKDKLKDAASATMNKTMSLASRLLDTTNDMLFNKLPAGWGKAMKGVGWLKDKLVETFNKITDIYIPGSDQPVIRALLLKKDYYKDAITGKFLHSVEEIKAAKGNILDINGNVVLTLEEMAKGLFDSKGKEIKSKLGSLFGTAKNVVSGAWDGLKTAGSKLLGMVGLGGLKDKAKEKWNNFKENGIGVPGISIGTTGNNLYRVVFDIRRILSQKFKIKVNNAGIKDPVSTELMASGKKLMESVKDKFKNFKNPFAGLGGKLKNSLGNFNWKDNRITSAASNAGNWLSEKGQGIGSWLGDKYQQAKDAYQDHRDAAEHQDSDEFVGPKKQSLKDKVSGYIDKKREEHAAKKKEKENFIGPEPKSKKQKLFDLLKKGKTSAKEKMDGLKEKTVSNLSEIKEKAANRIGGWKERLSRENRNKKELLKADTTPRYTQNVLGGMFDFITKGLGGIFGKVGGFISTALDFLGPIGKIARGLLGAAKFAGKAAMAVGRGALFLAKNARTIAGIASVVTSGVGSAVLGAASVAMTAIPAILGSPVVLGAAAVAAVGYGAYRVYKKYKQEKVDDFVKIRMRQYGLRFDGKDDHHADDIVKLENYLLEKSIGYRQGQAYIIDKNVDPEMLVASFSIDKNDEGMIEKFSEWFQKRFKPFFLTHLTALYALDDKAKLYEVRDMEAKKQIQFLADISFESGPYKEDVSPFKDVDSLEVNDEPVQNAIKILTEECKKNVKKDEKKVGEDATKVKTLELQAKRNAEIQGKIEVNYGSNAGSSEQNAPPPPTTTGVSTKDITGGEQVGQGTGDGVKPTPKSSGSATDNAGSSVAKAPGKVAGGPMLEGDQPSQYLDKKGFNPNGMNPAVLKNFYAMVEDYGTQTGKRLVATDGFRSYEQQAKLYREKPGLAAPPGRSMHEKGLAIDADSKTLNDMEKQGFMAKYGFTRPVGGEPWHMEPIGIQGNYKAARENPELAAQMTMAGLGKGGGGIGANPNSKKGERSSYSSMQQMGIAPKEGSQQKPISEVNSSDQAQVQTASVNTQVPKAESEGKELSQPSSDTSKNKPTSAGAGNAPSALPEAVKPSVPEQKKATQSPTVVAQAPSLPPEPPPPPKPKPVQPVSVMPSAPPRTAPAPLDLTSSLGDTNKILAESLTYHRNTFELIQTLVKNLSPEALSEMLKSVSQNAMTTPQATQPPAPQQGKATESAVSMARKKF